MTKLDLKAIAKDFCAANPGMSQVIADEYCSELNTMLKGVLDQKFTLKSYCDAKILILLWLMALDGNKKAKQKNLRKLLNETPLLFQLYDELVGQLKEISANPESAVKAQGFENELEMIEARMPFSPEMLRLYKAGKLTISMVITANPNLLLSNSG